MRCVSSYRNRTGVSCSSSSHHAFYISTKTIKSSYIFRREKKNARIRQILLLPVSRPYHFRLYTVYCSTVGTTALQVRTVHTYVLRASINIAIHIGFRRHADELWNYSCPSNLSSQQPIPTVQRSKHFLLLPQASETCKK